MDGDGSGAPPPAADAEDEGGLASILAGIEDSDLLSELIAPVEPEDEPATAPFEPAPYRCVKRTLVRSGFDTFTGVLGALEPAECVEILESRLTETGVKRLRFLREDGADGWISQSGPGGDFVVPASSGGGRLPAAAAATVAAAHSPAVENEAPTPTPTVPPDPNGAGGSVGGGGAANPVVSRVEMTRVATEVVATLLSTTKISVFSILCHVDDGGQERSWTAKRTYKQFSALRDKLVLQDSETFSALKFPAALWMGNETAPKTASLRRQALLAWLEECITHPKASAALLEFQIGRAHV